MKYSKFFFACLAAVALLSGCASTPKRDINDPNNCLYFGYIDMKDAPTWATDVNILQIWPPKEHGRDPHWTKGMDAGMFVFSTLRPGSYQVTQFVNVNENAVYDLPRQNNPTSVRIVKPGIYFVGSYKYVPVKTGFMEGGKFSIRRVATPTEAELLARILTYDDVQKSVWKKKIEARLAQLKR